MSKLQLDRLTKELLEDTADYFGCKPDVIRDVWEATLIECRYTFENITHGRKP